MGIDLQGHRGARGLIPENTIPSFVEALRHHVDALEFDVVIAGDGEVIVSHEPWIHHLYCSHPDGRPVTDDEAPFLRIFEMDTDQVQAFDCGRRGHPRFPQQKPMRAVKPRLVDMIAAVEAACATLGRPPVRYNVELKSMREWEGVLHPDPQTIVATVYQVLADAGVLERCAMQSFDPRVVNAIRRRDPDMVNHLLVENLDDLETNLARLNHMPHAYNPEHVLVTPALVEQIHARGLKIITWTVNEVERMEALMEMGVDGFITDYPDRAAKLLGRV